MFAGKKSAQIREILISESAWEEMTCLFAPSLASACDESPVLINRTDDGIIIEASGQIFYFHSNEAKQYPDELLELAHAGLMSLDGATSREGANKFLI
ncbi:hypothetical protein AB185_24440 [Klebsiella oxytoca]|nr:hypothetical protein AB185_24440 [Klebsiella oxytoca]